jgi:AbiV family abortive infection protein
MPKAYSTAVAVALFAREELGRYKILLDFWERADREGKSPTVHEIKKACDAHEEKQRRGQLSVMYRVDRPGKVLDLLRARGRLGNPEYAQAEKAIKKIEETTIKRTPGSSFNADERALRGPERHRQCVESPM